MNGTGPASEDLLERARQGDSQAAGELLSSQRDRLRRMVAARMDPRLAGRLDPSDVVQEALAQASQKLRDYLQTQPLPLYPWLRRIAWERLVQLHRRHLFSQKRSVAREQRWPPVLPDESVERLAGQLASNGTSPSEGLIRQELLAGVRAALDQLSDNDREILILRYVEQHSTRETAEVLGVSVAAAKTRLFRAIDRLHRRLTRG